MTTDKIRAAAQALHDAATPDTQRGLYGKFNVSRTDGSDHKGGKHYGCDYFVLDVTHDKHAPAALSAYASSVAATHPQLAADMRSRWGLAEPAQAAPAGDLERLAWDARQAMLDYGRACLGRDAEAVRDSTTRACAAIDALKTAATPPDHLAAMEAMQQENRRLKAENFALAAGQCIVPGGLRGDESGNQYCSLKANRSAQVADVMRLVDAYGEQCEAGRVSSPAMLAIESAVRKLAGEA